MLCLVLVVDDDKLQREMLNEFLTAKNCRVIMAEDGAAGVVMAEKHRPHIIIMDAMMPSMYGTSATKKLQELRETSGIPIIMRSSFEESALRKNLPEGEKVRYCSKAKPLPELWELMLQLLPEGGYTAR